MDQPHHLGKSGSMDRGLGQTRSEILPQVSWESGECFGRDSALVGGPLKARRSHELVHEQQATRSQGCSRMPSSTCSSASMWWRD